MEGKLSTLRARGKFKRDEIDADVWRAAKEYIDGCIDEKRRLEIGTIRYEDTILQVAANIQLIRNLTARAQKKARPVASVEEPR